MPRSFSQGLCSIRLDGSTDIKCSPRYFIAIYIISHGFKGASPPDKRQVSVTCWCPGWCEFWVRRKTKCQPEQPNSGGLPAKGTVAKKMTPNDLLLHSVSGPTGLKSLDILGNPLCCQLSGLVSKGKGEAFECGKECILLFVINMQHIIVVNVVDEKTSSLRESL